MAALSKGTWTLPAPLTITTSGTVAWSRGHQRLPRAEQSRAHQRPGRLLGLLVDVQVDD
jgi:hypothetical protein